MAARLGGRTESEEYRFARRVIFARDGHAREAGMGDQQYRKAYPGLWAWYDAHYPKPTQPRRSLLVHALVQRFSELHILASKTSRDKLRDIEAGDPSDVTFTIVRALAALYRATGIARFTALDSEIDELMSYVSVPKLKADEVALAEILEEKGFTVIEIIGLLPQLTKRLQQRPVSTRIQTVKAAELYDAGYSWTRVAMKLKPSYSSDQLTRFKESTRKSVKSLDKVFRKFRIGIPTRKSRA